MSNEYARGEDNDGALNPSQDTVAHDAVELELPAKTAYLPVLRAAIGVVAGTESFKYDEIVQLRIAVSEAFGLAIDRLDTGSGLSRPGSLKIRCVVAPDSLEVLVAHPVSTIAEESPEEAEGRAVIRSLVDRMELDEDETGAQVLRLVKYRSA